MWLLAVLVAAAVAGALLGGLVGKKWTIRFLVFVVVSWIAAFSVAAWLRSEPATTILGWGFILLLPASGIAAVAGSLADEFVGRRRGAEDAGDSSES